MKFLIVSIILAFSNATNAQSIDRTEIRNAIDDISSVPLKYNGKEGIWFPKADAAIVLDLISTRLKLALDIIDNQILQIDALKAAVDSYKQSKDSYAELADLNRTMFDTAMKNLPNLNPPEPAWYESSKATFIYGIVLGGAVVFGTTWLATKALNEQK